MDPAEQQLPPEIADVLQAARNHRAVLAARLLVHDERETLIEVKFDAELPSRSRGAGQSPTGVRPVEVAVIEFDRMFPRTAPRVTLRSDFNRSLAHINPHRPGEPVPPCILFGSVSEVFHQSGFVAVLDQAADWIRKAGRNELINPAQGWEPVRRDTVDDTLVLDLPSIHGLVDKKGGARKFKTWFIQSIGKDERPGTAWGSLRGDPVSVNVGDIPDLFNAKRKGNLLSGDTLAVVCWAGKKPSGALPVFDTYMPETVSTVRDLYARADAYACGQVLRETVSWLARCADTPDNNRVFSYPVFVLLCVRRPFPVIGSTSTIEVIAYRFNTRFPGFLPDGEETKVFPVAHRHPIRDELLRRMSGLDPALTVPKISLIGCGSLGSKLAVHLGRAAVVPSAVADMRSLDPHHMARHALLPEGSLGEVLLAPSKSKALVDALAPFGSRPTEVIANVACLEPEDQEFKDLFPADTGLVVNTTASHVVRDYLATTSAIPTRVAEAALLDRGRVGLFTLEGSGRNPDTLDLATLAYEEMRSDATFGGALTAAAATGNGIAVGQGCASVTMVMTDARLSMHAAPIAEKLLNLLSGGLPEHGELLLGHVGDDGMSLAWRRTQVGPTHMVTAENDPTWTVRVLDRAHQKIVDEVARYSHVETGGVIVGRVSPVRRLIHITDVLEAPLDSQRSAGAFVLGVQGLEARVTDYTRSAAGVLWCLGTWHSHLADQGASRRDYETARSLEGRGHRAAVLLIRRPGGYSAIVVPGG